ncbi:hypothetical protein [Flaviaesturariibacter amylovorans]|uniref:Beta-lactamase-inhibitor-like PepSY-like domain-containing protein n=1 Tax=Flaviaesturariibacter amylovorans TaxID=1084520 RepID=A0ABP8HPC8_9BACT
MKFLFILLLASLTTLVSSARTVTDDVTPAVLESFKSTFGAAKEVGWSTSSQYIKAQFTLDGQHINAFYNPAGELIALTRNITVSQLPVMLQAALKKEAAGAWISDLCEYSTDEGTAYYVTLENADMKITLRSSSNSSWTSFQKIRKI